TRNWWCDSPRSGPRRCARNTRGWNRPETSDPPMKHNGSAYVAIVIAALTAYFVYQWWFNPARAIKRRLGEVAAALSVPAPDSDIARVERLAQLREYLAEDVRIEVAGAQAVSSRQAALALVAAFPPPPPGAGRRERAVHRYAGERRLGRSGAGVADGRGVHPRPPDWRAIDRHARCHGDAGAPRRGGGDYERGVAAAPDASLVLGMIQRPVSSPSPVSSARCPV